MRRTSKAVGTLAAATSLALVGGGLALADVADNDVVNGNNTGSKTIDRGGETEIKYWIEQKKDPGESGSGACNVTSDNKATVTITVPSAVSAKAGTVEAAGTGASRTLALEFSSCGSASINSQTVKFSAPSDATYATHTIEHAATGGNPTVLLHNGINFDLIFADTTKPVVSVPADITETAAGTDTHKTVQFGVTATDNNSVTQINCTSAGSVALTGGALTNTATGKSRSFSGSFPIGEDTLTCTAKDGANNTSTAGTFAVTVNEGSSTPADTDSPSISFLTTGDYAPNGTGGWFKRGTDGATTAKVKVEATDPSGVTSLTCTVNGAAHTLTTTVDGTKRSAEITRTDDGTSAIACTATDGTNATPTDSPATHNLKLDNTLPTVTCPTGSASVVLLNAADATVTAGVSDGTGTAPSGIPGGATTKPSGTLNTETMHSGFTEINIADSAGNVGIGDNNNTSSTATGCAYSVQPKVTEQNAAIDGLGLTKAKSGATVPLKFRLLDANNAAVVLPVGTTAGAAVKSVTCDLAVTADAQAETAAGSSGLQNLGDGYYQFNWKTPSTYGNSCKTFTLSIPNTGGLQQSSNFQFTK